MSFFVFFFNVFLHHANFHPLLISFIYGFLSFKIILQ